MTKFKKAKFEFQNIVLFPDGRYALIAGTFDKQKAATKILNQVIDEGNLGEPYLLLKVNDIAFRYLAKKIQPSVDRLPLMDDCIVLMAPSAYIMSDCCDVPERLVK